MVIDSGIQKQGVVLTGANNGQHNSQGVEQRVYTRYPGDHDVYFLDL